MFAVLAAFPTGARAQAVIDQKGNTLEVKSSEGKEVITILHDEAEEGFSLKIGGFNINLQAKPEELPPTQYIALDVFTSRERVVARQRRLPWIDVGNFQIGFIGLNEPDYSMYSPETPAFLDLNHGRSVSFAFEVTANFPLDYRGRVWLSGGLRPRWDNYSFADPYTIIKADGMIQPQALDTDGMKDYKKSKLTTFSIDVPLILSFSLSRYFSIGGGVYGGFVLADYTKYKFPKVKDHGDFGLNFFQAGATIRVKIWRVGAFFNYNFTPLFKDGVGPKTQPYMFGIMF